MTPITYLNKAEDEIENEQAAWAVQQATLFIKAIRNLITQQQ